LHFRPEITAGEGSLSLLGPIFAREWLTVPRRSRHYVMRAAYLGALWILGLTAWQATVGWNRTATLGDAARFNVMLFQLLTLRVQLPLLLFFAALSAASAITQEKDRRTFVLLLLTDLRNYEIVLGKLLGSLLQIALFLAGTVPLLAILLLLGGVAPSQVAQAVLVLATAALAAGSLGTLVALWRDKTFPALALTALFLVLYLCLVQALGVLPSLIGHWGGSGAASWDAEPIQQWLDPFMALKSVQDPTKSSLFGIAPAFGFSLVMVVLSTLLNGWGILRLRAWNPSGEPIMQREAPTEAEAEEKDRAKAHAAPGIARHVWANPILWREVQTRAYGRLSLIIKTAYAIVVVLISSFALAPVLIPWLSKYVALPSWIISYYAMTPAFTAAGPSVITAVVTGLIPVGILSMLLVSAQAVTAITSERDIGALDLLLVTDLTPKEFIFGKLMGIVYNTRVYLLPPFILAGIYAGFHMLARPPRNHPELSGSWNAEALFALVVGLVVLFGFVLILGIHIALRIHNSRMAIINALGTVFFLTIGTAVCISLILINGRFEYQWTSFVLFIAAAIGGLWWVLNGDRPSTALGIASLLCPLAVIYSVIDLLVAKPGSEQTADPLLPLFAIAGAFGFGIAAMLVPLISEFDVALGRTSGAGE
jgi:ABC-type transport system involved in multi-copper enzyme maturation permease subunit